MFGPRLPPTLLPPSRQAGQPDTSSACLPPAEVKLRKKDKKKDKKQHKHKKEKVREAGRMSPGCFCLLTLWLIPQKEKKKRRHREKEQKRRSRKSSSSEEEEEEEDDGGQDEAVSTLELLKRSEVNLKVCHGPDLMSICQTCPLSICLCSRLKTVRSHQ